MSSGEGDDDVRTAPESSRIAGTQVNYLSMSRHEREKSTTFGGRKGPLDAESRKQIALVRKSGACDECRRRKIRCRHARELVKSRAARPFTPSTDESLTAHAGLQFSHRANGIGFQFSQSSELPTMNSDGDTFPVIQSSNDGFTPSAHSEPWSRSVESSTLNRLPFQQPSSDIAEKNYPYADLETFCKDLQVAADLAFPSWSMSRYSSVHVLLLRWEEQDEQCSVSNELALLADVFRITYGFDIEIGLIPNQQASMWILGKLLKFVEMDKDSQDTLKIVYYGGHSFISKGRQAMWSNHSENHPKNIAIDMHSVQSLLIDAKSDVLLIVDACVANVFGGQAGNGVTEVIAAAAYSTVKSPPDYSFTSAITAELSVLASNRSFSVSELFTAVYCRMVLDDQRTQTPVHLALTAPMVPRSITISQNQKLRPDLERPGGGALWRNTAVSSASAKPSMKHYVGPESIASESRVANLYPNPLQDHRWIHLTIKLNEYISVDNLSTKSFIDWMKDIPAPVEQVKVGAQFAVS